MVAKKNTKADLIIEAIEFVEGKGGKRTAGRYLHQKYPLQFPNIESGRKAVAYYCGAGGEHNRKMLINKEYMYKLSDLPKSQAENWTPYILDHKKHQDVLILSDIHFPYHTEAALDAAINEGIKNKCKLVILNGDTLDMFQMSVYDKRPDKPAISLEFEMARNFIELMRKTFKNILFKVGNHEERWEKFLMRNPAIFSVPEFQLQTVLQLKDEEYVTDKRVIKAGKLNILHGHEFGGFMSNPVSFARTISLKTGESTIAGHCHQTSEQPFTRLSGDMITCWSQGSLSELHPQYRPINQWNHGFSMIHIEKDGVFHVSNKRIKNGKIY
jgi:predicted phosphodiesterase